MTFPQGIFRNVETGPHHLELVPPLGFAPGRPTLALAEIFVGAARLLDAGTPAGLVPARFRRLAQALREGGAFPRAWENLALAERQALEAWLGADALALRDLSTESDPALFAEGLLAFGRGRLLSERPALGIAALAWLRDSGGTESARAREELGAVTGEGSFGRRFEYLGRSFVREAADPASISAMAAGTYVFSAVRAGVLGRLLAMPSAGLLTSGLGARALASTAAFVPEVAAFWGTNRALHPLFSSEASRWDSDALHREWGSLALTLGLLKLGGVGSQAVLRAWGGTGASAFARVTRQAFTQGSLLASLSVAHAIERRFNWTPESRSEHPALDAFATLLQFHVGSRLSGETLGPDFAARNHALEANLRQVSEGRRSPPRLWSGPGPAFVTPGPGEIYSDLPAQEDPLRQRFFAMSVLPPEEKNGRPGQALAADSIDSGTASNSNPSPPSELARSLEPLLQGLRASVDDATLHDFFSGLSADAPLYHGLAQFSPQDYFRRVLLREGEGEHSFEVLVLGWEDGQGTVPHDHGGSSGFDMIVSGEAEETHFQLGKDGSLEAAGRRTLRAGDISHIQSDAIHTIFNRQGGGRRLVSLHVYRPILNSTRIRRFLPLGQGSDAEE